jgi:hypothetical protein
VEEVLGLRQVKDADLPQAVVLRVAQDVAERAERQVAGTEDDAEDARREAVPRGAGDHSDQASGQMQQVVVLVPRLPERHGHHAGDHEQGTEDPAGQSRELRHLSLPDSSVPWRWLR